MKWSGGEFNALAGPQTLVQVSGLANVLKATNRQVELALECSRRREVEIVAREEVQSVIIQLSIQRLRVTR